MYLQENGSVVALVMFAAIVCHSVLRSASRGASQSTCFCQNCQRKSFALMVTGYMNPNGSKIPEDYLRTSLLVVAGKVATTVQDERNN